MLKGPFPIGSTSIECKPVKLVASTLTDAIDYRLPFQPFSNVAGGWVLGQLETMFRYRHSVTAQI